MRVQKMESVVIVSALRSPFCAMMGKFKDLSAINLGSHVIEAIMQKANGCRVDSLYMGCVLTAGLGQSVARQVAIGGGLHDCVHAVNVNKVCGSGMISIMVARNAILSGDSEISIAGGVESMTNAPYLLVKAREGYRFGDGKLVDSMINDGLLDPYENCVMGEYAEDTAEKYGFSRDDQDKYALKSFEKARLASQNGILKEEMISISVKSRKAEYIVEEDETVFATDLSKIPGLRPAFRKDGTITAASASSIADGAAATLLMKESMARKLGFPPVARIVAQATYSHSPKLFTIAPVGAIKEVLRKSNWSIDDVELFEINEAFAVVPMAAAKELDIDLGKVNIFGGACAIGHPLGASGTRVIVTLINALKAMKKKKGVATLCIGGGEGVAMSIEIVDD